MRDRRISQHALQIGLRDGCKIAHQQRTNGQHRKHLLPVDGQREQTIHQKTDGDGKGSQFGGATNHQCHRGRGTLVHIGNPHVEGHHAQLECQAGHHEHQTEHQHLVTDLPGVDGLEDLANVERTCRTIDHRQAIQQEPAGHGAQHEILHRSFGGCSVVAAQGHQGIAGQRQQFQTQIDHQEVVARDHDEHAQQRKHRQGEHLTAAQHVAVCRIGAAVDQRDHHGHRGKALEPVAHGIADHHVAKPVERIATAGIHGLQRSDHCQREHGQHVSAGTARAVHTQIDQRDHAGHGQQHDFGVNREPADVVNHLLESLSSAWTAQRA